MLWNTTRALKLLFQLVHFHGQENVLGGEIPNLLLEKELRFSRFAIDMEEGLLHPFLKVIGACP